MVGVYRYAGFGEEPTFGQGAAEIAYYADIMSSSLDVPANTELMYAGGLGRGARLHRPGFYSPTGNIVMGESMSSLGRMLRRALGGYVFTGSSPLNMHEIYAVNDTELPSFMTAIGKDVFQHLFYGCVVNSLQLEVSDGYLISTADIVASHDATSELQTNIEDELFSDPPFVFHEIAFWLGADNVSAKVSSMKLNISNSADAAAGRGLTYRHPCRIPVGARTVQIDLTVQYEDTAHLEAVWGDTDGPSQGGSVETTAAIELDGGLFGDGSTFASINFNRALITSVQTQPSGQSRIDQSLSFQVYTDTFTLNDATEVDSELLIIIENDAADMSPIEGI